MVKAKFDRFKRNRKKMAAPTSASLKFAADRMLGRLAKWLRVIGQDVIYGRHLSGYGLIHAANFTQSEAGAAILITIAFESVELCPYHIRCTA